MSESLNDQQTTQVRRRTDADVSACAELLREVYALDGYPVEGVDDAEGWMYPVGLIAAWVAVEASGEVLGHAAVCEPNDDDAAVPMLIDRAGGSKSDIVVLARLFVGPAARGRGLGRSLANAALDYAREKRLRAVFDVMEKDRNAIRIYEQMGCVLLGHTSHQIAGGRTVPALCYAAPGVLGPDAR
jgi:ribosomal protein S18 acetylase RimI-like enzyme